MLRRLLPTLVALGCGLLALGWGLVSLQRIFSQERDDAHAQVQFRRQALEHVAAEALRQELMQRLRASIRSITHAVENPLAPGDGFYYRLRGQEQLPRVNFYRPGTDTPARDTYEALAASTQNTAFLRTWEPYLSRLHMAEAAHLAGNSTWAYSRLRELLRYVSDNPLPPEQELPFLLLAMERLQQGPESEGLLQLLVRDGMVDEFGGIGRSMGIQRDLLRARDSFTEADFEFLHHRIRLLSQAMGKPTSDFDARVADAKIGKLVFPQKLVEPILVGEKWYLEPQGDTVFGIAVDMPTTLYSIAEDMRARRLFGAEGQVRLRPGTAVPLKELRVTVDLPEWARSEADIEARYWLKTLLVTMCGGLALAIFALAVVAQERKYRFLELKSDFVATVSHELRTPLASIRLMGETLERKLAHVPEVRDYPSRIVQASDGLHFLVENILSFNRIDKGRWQLRSSRFRLEELVNPLRDDLANATSVPVRVTADMGDAELEGDPSLLRLLFANLGRNACAYNRRSPVEISITAQAIEGHGCTVLFQDNGMGIPETEWQNVFLDFYRVTVPGHEVHGSGLGLALCRKIMRLHQGDIEIANSGPEGTTFVLTFPELP